MKAAVEVEPYKPEFGDALSAAAAADGHGVLDPTHVVRKSGEIVGYLGVFATPVVTMWLHSGKVDYMDSLGLWGRFNSDLKELGVRRYVVPCSARSPFHRILPRLGCREWISGSLFVKEP
jgi:hypothetical protein